MATSGARRVVWVGIALAVAAVAVCGTLFAGPWLSARVRAEAIALLESRLDGTVSLEALDIDLWPRVVITGRGLQLEREPGQHDVPFLRIGRFAAAGSVAEFWSRRIALVTLEDLAIVVDKGKRERRARQASAPKDITIARVEVARGLLRVVPDNPQKLPLEFELRRVELEDFSFDRPASYRATVGNPRPEGTVNAEGRFGPWVAAEPRRTPLEGQFVLQDARLATFRGIGGVLRSEGTFDGVLQELHVDGTSTTPDFQLDAVGQPIALATTFRATVDGTRGDTTLHQVDITLGESALVAKGSIAGEPGAKGRTLALDAEARDARLEDILRLTVPSAEPPMTGRLGFRATVTLPPGEPSVVERLSVNGTFQMRQLLFTSDKVQDRVDELSRRGQGRPTERLSDVTSGFEGKFDLTAGVMRLPRLDFAVNGARVRLGGTYGLQGGALDFAGVLRLDAPVSRLTTGWKSAVLKVVDPVFRRDGAGTVLPIHLRGTVAKPAFGVDMKKAFLP